MQWLVIINVIINKLTYYCCNHYTIIAIIAIVFITIIGSIISISVPISIKHF